MASVSPAVKKTTKKGSAKPKSAKTAQAVSVQDLLAEFQTVADNHMSVVKRVRTAIAPGASIITAHGDTDK
ncbi:MAG TPA: hypothetical protein VFQ91_03075 [Bryobacteraceae bacterium]|nr:hypothetical protein [Bryobacteraceae bacterium]